MTMRFYDQMNREQKRKVREIIGYVKELRENQREIFDRNIIKPITDVLKLEDDVKKSRIPFEHYLRSNEELSKHLKDFCGATKCS